MKMVLLVVYCIIIITLSHTRAGKGSFKQNDIASSCIDTSGFKKDIQPILQKNCSPCHFAGGKMYAKMPFDKVETIISHEAGAIKRFSDKKEKELLKQFIENNKLH